MKIVFSFFQTGEHHLATALATKDATPFIVSQLDPATRYEMGHSLEDMLKYCNIVGIECDLRFASLSKNVFNGLFFFSDFKLTQDLTHGNC